MESTNVYRVTFEAFFIGNVNKYISFDFKLQLACYDCSLTRNLYTQNFVKSENTSEANSIVTMQRDYIKN